jgi:hypothetical protein
MTSDPIAAAVAAAPAFRIDRLESPFFFADVLAEDALLSASPLSNITISVAC